VVFLVYTVFLSKLRGYDRGSVLRSAAKYSKSWYARDCADTGRSGDNNTGGSGGSAGTGAQDRNYDSFRTGRAAAV
jgi:hypothetical protein